MWYLVKLVTKYQISANVPSIVAEKNVTKNVTLIQAGCEG
jgi:hypothetical protein